VTSAPSPSPPNGPLPCPRHRAVGYRAAFAVAAVIGIAYGVWLRSSRPSVYQAIGVGADALAGP
jgi:hypothetical protein